MHVYALPIGRSPAVPMSERLDAPAIAERARRIRRASLRMVHAAKMGHPGGDLSAADILATLLLPGALA